MTYEPQGIQQQGRSIKVRKEARGRTSESSESKGGENGDSKRKKKPRTEEQIERDREMRRIREARRRKNPRRINYVAEYKIKHRDELREKQAGRRKVKNADPKYRINHSLRARLARFINGVGTGSIEGLIGCSKDQLIARFEQAFKRGMSWDNYGHHWHIDHILPCASFDQSDPKQRAQCWHWTNLRPLEAKRNIEKSDTITEPQMSLLLCATH